MGKIGLSLRGKSFEFSVRLNKVIEVLDDDTATTTPKFSLFLRLAHPHLKPVRRTHIKRGQQGRGGLIAPGSAN